MTNISRRNLLRTAGGLGVAGALAACGSNTGRSSGGSGGKKTINQWYHQYGEAGTEQAAKKYAAAYTDANVKVQWTPGDYDSKIGSGLLSSSGPDVFEWHFNYQLAKSGQVVPLDDVIADVKSDFSDTDIAANSLDGKVYGVRIIDDPQIVIYRKSMLDKAGIAPPATLADLVTAAKALTTKDVRGAFLGNDNGVDWTVFHLIKATGASLLTDDNKVGFDTPEVAAMFDQMKALVASKTMLTGAPTDWWDPSAFNQGLCAISRQGMWALPAIIKALGEDEVGVLPTPAAGPNGKPAVYIGGWTAFVSSKATDVDAAKKFLRWLWVDKTDYQEDWALNYGFHIPPRKSLAAKATKLQTGRAAETVKLAEQYGWGDNPAFTTVMQTALKDACTNVIVKGKDSTTELAAAATKVDAELKKLFG